MTRAGALEPGTVADVRLCFQRPLATDHPGQASKLLFADEDGEPVPVRVYRSSPVRHTDWRAGGWYALVGATVRDDDGLHLRATTDTSAIPLPEGPDRETRLLHLADTHLGYRAYGLDERERDFETAFERALSVARKRGVDAVVHTGDLTHATDADEPLPPAAEDALAALADADVPFYFLLGNHDVADGRPQRWVDELTDRGLGERLGTSPTRVGGVALYGVDYHPPEWWVDREFSFGAAPRGTTPVLGMHQSVAPLAPTDDAPVDAADLLRATDVPFAGLLLGHSHYTNATRVAGVSVCYAGSPERTTRGYRDEPTVVGEVSVSGGSLEWTARDVDSRPFPTFTVVGDGAPLDELLDGVETAGVVTVFVGGSAPPDLRAVERGLENAGALHARAWEADATPAVAEGVYACGPDELAVRHGVRG